MARPAIFLDRDGTLNFDAGYTHRIADWRWLPGALAGLKAFASTGYPLVIASNQSGIARGYYNFGQLKELESWLGCELARQGVTIAAWRYCPHGPEDKCSCRKPAPGLLVKAAADLDIDLKRSWMIGDRLSDLQAGMAAGCHTAIVHNSAYKDEARQARELQPEVLIGSSLAELAPKIISNL